MAAAPPGPRSLPPVLGRLLKGTFWLTLRTPLQAVFTLWSVPLIVGTIGKPLYGAFGFAWGFGFLQFLLEFGIGSALQRTVSDRWTRGDRAGVDRAIACGLTFYAATAAIQAALLLAIAGWFVPPEFQGASARLIVRLLWLQAITAPCYGLTAVVSSVLQAARRYDFIPRYEMAVVILRFAILVAGLRMGFDFFLVVAAQTVVQVVLSLGPALWVMIRELGHLPHFRGFRRDDFRALVRVSVYVFLIQLSVVLADKVDTLVLGYALADPAPAIAVYNTISKPFLQIRQTGWMLSYLVMPAVASLAAARDARNLERVTYDGSRLLIGLLLPVALLAWIDAGPFLEAWVGAQFPGQVGEMAGLLRLFLVATTPLLISVLVQVAIGQGHVRPIALWALAGSLVNLPISYLLTIRLHDVSGVIWGTVLTTLLSNLIGPAIYVFRVLEVRPSAFLSRTLSAPASGALALLAATWASRSILGAGLASTFATRTLPLIAHLTIGSLAYLAGYLLTPAGRSDLRVLLAKLRRRGEAR